MKKRIIGATLITVVCALLISNLVGVLLFRSREMDAARNTLQELLVLMDAQSAITDPDGLAQQFHAAAPDKRLTIIDTDGTVLADTEANPQTLEDTVAHSAAARPARRPSIGGCNPPGGRQTILYPTPRTVVMMSSPSFWRRALTCISTVRVSPV